MVRSSLALLIGFWVPGATRAADFLPPASQRFVAQESDAAPDFQRHVVPLLGKLGCNGRACHGSFEGQAGFRLSLFGYDFQADHRALTEFATDADERRVDTRSPEASLMLTKPTLAVEHEGGRRYPRDGWEYRLLRTWIAEGAKSVEQPNQLIGLEVEPSEFVFSTVGAAAPLRVIALWKDGAREDVTCLCRFRSNDDAVAVVDDAGRVTAGGTGDTHVVAFYDRGVVAVPVLLPISDRTGDAYPEVATPTEVDRLVVAKLRKLGIVPSETCTDAEFLRRVSIDVTGTLPTPREVETFLADAAPEKRSRKIDELLERPAYAAWWANKLCDFTGCNPRQQSELGQELSTQWFSWIHQRLLENAPYDELVERIVTALGRGPDQSYERYATEMSAYFREQGPADFADRATMPYFWSRRSLKKPADQALAFAHAFLGIRLNCAQCHKHPFDRWTVDDFTRFSEFFADVRYGVAPESIEAYREIAKTVGMEVKGDKGKSIGGDLLAKAAAGTTIPWRELYLAQPESERKLVLLDGVAITVDADDDPRGALMRWMRRKDNPYFARAFVNRVWANYYHRGLIDPTDETTPANPPSNRALLDHLANGFVEQGYDMKWLHREIVGSATYQRSWRPNETNRSDRRNFSRAVPRRLPAEVVYDAIKQVTAASDRADQVRRDLSRRAVGHLSMRMAGTYAMRVFGKPARAVNCDCERVADTSLLQAVFLQNDPLVQQRLESSGWLAEIAEREAQAGSAIDRERLVSEAFLRCFGRRPTDQETQRSLRHLEESDSTASGIRDLLWALINAKEFILNH